MMDFVSGNLDEYLHPERHLDPAQQGALGAAPKPQEEPEVPPQVCWPRPHCQSAAAAAVMLQACACAGLSS